MRPILRRATALVTAVALCVGSGREAFAQMRTGRAVVPAGVVAPLGGMSPLITTAGLAALPPLGSPLPASLEPSPLAPQARVSVAAASGRASQPLVPAAETGREKEQKLIDRVLTASIALERAETNGAASEEELKVTADKVWGELVPAKPVAGEVEAAPGGVAPPLSKRGGKLLEEKKGPPSASPSPIKSVAMPVLRSILDAVAWVTAAAERVAVGALDLTLSPFSRALSQLTRRLPGSLVMASAASATVAVDYAARALLPVIFGFVPAAGLWVAAGLGGVMIPALVAVRFSLARKGDPAVAPLIRYADGLLGVLVGAAIVAVVGVLGSDIAAAFTAPRVKGGGLLNPASFLGAFAFMAAMPVVYGAGHAAWGLRRGVAAALRFPIPFPLSVSLLPMFINPLLGFLAFTGGVPMFLAVPLMAAAAAVYFRSRRHLESMTATRAANGPASVESGIDQQWRLDRLPGNATTPDKEIRRARFQAVGWGAALVLGSVALLLLQQLSLPAALAAMMSALSDSIKYMLPVFLLGGLLVVFFKEAAPITRGAYPETVRELAARAGLPTPKVYADKAEGPPNAFAAGMLQRMSVVAVMGCITRLMTVRELRGVLAHELSHVRYRHMLALFGALAFFPAFGAAASLLQLMVAYWAPLIWMACVMGLMRANERMADAGAAKLLGDSRGLATGLRKFALMGMDSGKVPDREGSLLYRLLLTHPDPLERVQTLGRMAGTKSAPIRSDRL